MDNSKTEVDVLGKLSETPGSITNEQLKDLKAIFDNALLYSQPKRGEAQTVLDNSWLVRATINNICGRNINSLIKNNPKLKIEGFVKCIGNEKLPITVPQYQKISGFLIDDLIDLDPSEKLADELLKKWGEIYERVYFMIKFKTPKQPESKVINISGVKSALQFTMFVDYNVPNSFYKNGDDSVTELGNKKTIGLVVKKFDWTIDSSESFDEFTNLEYGERDLKFKGPKIIFPILLEYENFMTTQKARQQIELIRLPGNILVLPCNPKEMMALGIKFPEQQVKYPILSLACKRHSFSKTITPNFPYYDGRYTKHFTEDRSPLLTVDEDGRIFSFTKDLDGIHPYHRILVVPAN